MPPKTKKVPSARLRALLSNAGLNPVGTHAVLMDRYQTHLAQKETPPNEKEQPPKVVSSPPPPKSPKIIETEVTMQSKTVSSPMDIDVPVIVTKELEPTKVYPNVTRCELDTYAFPIDPSQNAAMEAVLYEYDSGQAVAGVACEPVISKEVVIQTSGIANVFSANLNPEFFKSIDFPEGISCDWGRCLIQPTVVKRILVQVP